MNLHLCACDSSINLLKDISVTGREVETSKGLNLGWQRDDIFTSQEEKTRVRKSQSLKVILAKCKSFYGSQTNIDFVCLFLY